MSGILSIRNRLPHLLRILIVAISYFILARLSLLLSFQSSNATPIWPPSGFAFAMILLFGYRITPGILLGAFAANLAVFRLDHDADLSTASWVSFIISIGNTAEAITGYYLLKKLIPGVKDNNYFSKVNHIFYFFPVAIIMSLVSSSIGIASIHLGNFITSGQQQIVWLTWWLGDVSGILLVTPFILIWINFFRSQTKRPFSRSRIIETATLFLLVILTSEIVFNNWFISLFIFKWAFWIIPVVVWAATRFNQHETITAIVLCSAIAIWGTLNGHGPFFNPTDDPLSDLSLNQSLLITQGFISIIVITTLTLNASIIERKKTEEALRNMGDELEKRVNERTADLEDRSRFIETLFDSVEDLMAVFDKKGNYLSVNRRVEEVYKLNRKDIIGKNVLTLFPEVNESGMYSNMQKAFAGEAIHDIAYRSVISKRWFENFYIPLRNNKQEVYAVLVIGHDNTTVLEASEKIKQMAGELIQKNRQLELTNKELESFTFVASHDLQEPLRKIRIFLNLIAEKEMALLSDNGKNYLNRTINTAGQMQQLIIDLLSYSRTNGSEEHFQKTDMNVILQKVKTELKEIIEEKKASIEAITLPAMNVIPFQFEQLFTNLISNSLKFSKRDVLPHIIIRAEIVNGVIPDHGNGDPGKKYYCFSISDNGIGFETKYNEKVFDLFQRLHNRSEYSGTGIGLSICKRIVENHKGFITASGEPGKGATFTIYLPA